MFGEKTKRLERLRQAGFLVPPFFAVSSEDMGKKAEDIAEAARKSLSAGLFAVRSSALSEDTDNSSLAGQFLTRLAVPRRDLAEAIDAVRSQAREKLGDLSHFSLIIQEFIEPDFSGVTFTRNPDGDREMVLEYHRGRGDKVVGGEVKPERLAFYRSTADISSSVPNIMEGRTLFLKIEKLFELPQDIEWCIRGGKWHILQSRPITSLKKEQIIAIDALEKELPNGKFYFAKTEACDVAPRPSKETLMLLKEMYGTDGPVERAYKNLGIAYSAKDFLVLFGGELYVDREKELQTLFPSHSYFIGSDYSVKPAKLKGFWTSLRNTRRLQNLKGNVQALALDLKGRLAKESTATTVDEIKKEFFADYEVIFQINLFTERSLDSLKRALPKSVTLTEALQYFPADLGEIWDLPTDIIGNTFELSDTSAFVSFLPVGEVKEIPGTIPLKPLKDAQLFLRLREYGRVLALRHLTRLKKHLNVTPPNSSGVSLPVTLTDIPRPQNTSEPLGVSAGQASGKLVLTPEEGGILVVSALTPDIANSAHLLKGVIADHGGLLSHFAIIAREMGLPVIVNYPISTLKIGSSVQIDGTTGAVTKL
jgi:phosphohistidine swiveling domain-containing protein